MLNTFIYYSLLVERALGRFTCSFITDESDFETMMNTACHYLNKKVNELL